jgi:hypothetical protein
MVVVEFLVAVPDAVFDAIRELMAPPPAPKRRIGFVQGE